MNSKTLRAAWLGLLFLMAAGGWSIRAQEAATPSEYEVKAAFLYNFAKFVEWPTQTFPDNDTPLTIGILGKSPLGADLERVVKGKTVNGRPLNVKTVASSTEAASSRCQIIFITASEMKKAGEILEALKGKAVMTVGESDGFADLDGMINFVMEGKKVRFQINDEAATRAGLKVSSKLLSLARKREVVLK